MRKSYAKRDLLGRVEGPPTNEATFTETIAVPVVTAAEVLHPGTNRGPNGEQERVGDCAGLEAAVASN